MLLSRRCRKPAVGRLQPFARACQDIRQKRSQLAGGIEAVIQTLRRHAANAELQECGCNALRIIVQKSRGSVQRANAAGALDAVVASGAAAVTQDVFDAVCRVLYELVPGHEAAALLAGALEALEQRTAPDANETARSRLIRLLQPAAQQHDACPCTHGGCKRCAAARARGAMCALAGCMRHPHPRGRQEAAVLHHVPHGALLRRGAPAGRLAAPQAGVLRGA
jgi:hypothetical protein